MDVICAPLAVRLAKLIGGLHFQVAERTLQLWVSERFKMLVVKSNAHRSTVLTTIFPVLHKNQCVPVVRTVCLETVASNRRTPFCAGWITGTKQFAQFLRR